LLVFIWRTPGRQTGQDFLPRVTSGTVWLKLCFLGIDVIIQVARKAQFTKMAKNEAPS
jgi:hypothetical protein